MRGLCSFILAVALVQHLGIFVSPTSTVIQPSDLTYLGAIRMPTTIDTTYAYGGMAVRQVAGETHFFIYGRNNLGVDCTVASGASTTIFTVNTGCGTEISNGQVIDVWRAAASTAVAEERTVSTVSGDVVTLTTALGGTPAASDYVFKPGDAVYELTDPEAASCGTGSYNTTYTSAPRACLYAAWGDIYHGHRVSWLDNGTQQNPQGIIPGGLVWNDTTSLLYSCSYQQYVVGSIYPCMAATLDNVGTLASTAYGPWKFAQSVDGNTNEGTQVAFNLQSTPGGTMLAQGDTFQIFGWPAGPNLHAEAASCGTCSLGWPTTSTTGGYGAVLETDTRYLHYYNMENVNENLTGNYYNFDGSVTGNRRSFQRTLNPYVFESNYELPRIDGNPALNGGLYSWTELDTPSGCMWLQGSAKNGILCTAALVGSPGGDTSDCATGTHHWYVNSGSGVLLVTSVVGTFSVGEGLTGGTSGATGIVSALPASGVIFSGSTGVTDYSPGETITGGTSGATATVSTWERSSKCTHGCNPAIVVTGPQANHWYPALAIFDPVDANAVSAGTKTDYTVFPKSMADLSVSPFSIHTGGNGGNFNGGGGHIAVGGFDATRNYLFLVAVGADDTAPCNGGADCTLIHVFQVNDNLPSPIPIPLTLLHLAERLHLTTGHP